MKIKVLVCDDASFLRDLIKRTLRKFLPQTEFFEASDGRKAQTLISREALDLVLSDWEMPGMSGEELLSWVRTQEKLASLPFIMITSLSDKEHILRAVQAGVSDYLNKPFTPEELMSKVRKALVKSGKLSKSSIDAVSPKGGPFSSLEILSGKSDTPGGAAAALSSITKVAEKPKIKGTGLISWDNNEIKCMIKSISVVEVTLVCKRAERHPGIFQRVMLTLTGANAGGNTLQGIAGFTLSIAAVEKHADSEFVTLLIRYADLTAAQQQFLNELVVNSSA
jgi:CheY-like chemotaxis protein